MATVKVVRLERREVEVEIPGRCPKCGEDLAQVASLNVHVLGELMRSGHLDEDDVADDGDQRPDYDSRDAREELRVGIDCASCGWAFDR